MSTSTTFKQECPSCEALIPIRDPKLVGKKTECPKCKFKFVVKAPPEDAAGEDQEEDAPAKPAAKTKKGGTSDKITDKPKKGDAKITDKAKPAKSKKSKNDDDSEGGDKKKQKDDKKKWLQYGLAIVAVVVLIVVGVTMMSGDKPKVPKGGTPVNPGGTVVTPTTPTKSGTTGGSDKEKSAKLSNPTNLLPKETTGVSSLNIERLSSSTLWKAALSDGPFREGPFQELFGFPLSESKAGVTRVILATNTKANWVFSVVRTQHTLERDDLRKRLKLGPEVKVNGHAYRLVGKQFDSLGALLFKGCKPCDSFAVHFVDAQTLVFGDEDIMKKFLEERPKAGDDKKDPVADSESYVTLTGDLQKLIRDAEGTKAPLLSMAGDFSFLFNELAAHRDPILRQVKILVQARNHPFEVDPLAKAAELLLPQEIQMFGLGLVELEKGKVVVNLAIKLRTSDTAGLWHPKIEEYGKSLTNTAGVNPMPMGTTGSTRTTPTSPLTSQLLSDRIVLAVDVPIKGDQFDLILLEFAKDLVLLKSESDLAYTGPRFHQLGAALKKYVDDNKTGEFPRGTAPRKNTSDKDDPRDPRKRPSWAVALLPFLDASYKKEEKKVDPEKAWDEGVNLRVAELIVPHYIVRARGMGSYRTTYPNVSREVGAGHWVAMAGVGLDAARYAPGDKGCGIFGYDRVTKRDDIPKDRLDKVIALIQVPADSAGPWIAGGGATLRGVAAEEDKDNPLQPFLCEFEIKTGDKVEKFKGTHAIMADGRVRFISDTVTPQQFRSMCQIQWPDKMDKFDKFDEVVPLVPNEEDAPPVTAPPDKAEKPVDKPTDKPTEKPTDKPDKPKDPPKPPKGGKPGG